MRQAGVNVVSHQTTSPLPGVPLVYVNVKVVKIEEKYAYNVDIMCLTTPQDHNYQSKLTNCHVETSGLVPELIQVRGKVGDLVNLFIKDHLSAMRDNLLASFLSSNPGQPPLRLTGLVA